MSFPTRQPKRRDDKSRKGMMILLRKIELSSMLAKTHSFSDSGLSFKIIVENVKKAISQPIFRSTFCCSVDRSFDCSVGRSFGCSVGLSFGRGSVVWSDGPYTAYSGPQTSPFQLHSSIKSSA